MKTYALCRSEYGTGEGMLASLKSEGIEIVEFADIEGLRRILDEGISAILLVDPYPNLPRLVRAFLDGAGGWISRLPMLLVLTEADADLSYEVLKHADDFAIGPRGAKEVITRIELHALRHGGSGKVITAGDLLINLDAYQVYLEGRPLDLTYKEFELLRMMAATPGRAYNRDELLRRVWGYDYLGGTRTVDVHIRRLRSKIEAHRRYIETVHGVGYRFVC